MKSNNQKLEELLRQMYAEEGLRVDDQRSGMETAKDTPTNCPEQTIDEEWRKFEAKHFGSEKSRSSLQKFAAMFAGVLMLSGIAYATVKMVWPSAKRDSLTQTKEMRMEQPYQQTAQEEKQDTLQLRPIIFEGKDLSTILDEVAAYYQYEVVYQNKDSKHIRLYFTWDKSQSIETVIETFNRFERISIQIEDKKLIVE